MKSNFINLPLLTIKIGIQSGLPLLYCRQTNTLVISIKRLFRKSGTSAKNDHSVEAAKLLEKEAFGVIP